jgi:hypothetical protein
VAVTAQHGDRLEVIEIRRRFAHVRTAAGIDGWADVNNLLAQEQVNGLEKLSAEAAKLPSQGQATVYDVLNIHTGPVRSSPSFSQIPEGGKVDVLSHRVTLHASAAPAPAARAVREKKSKSATKSEAKKNSPVPPPPMPPPPPPPANWLELSVSHSSPAESAPQEKKTAAKPGGDDWYLVRTQDGQAGWVLARNLFMLIPDEVAQYAEGHRIAAYLPLGQVTDRGEGKGEGKRGRKRDRKPAASEDAWETRDPTPHENWLWATQSGSLTPYDFDSFRVFVWSLSRHRYETAFIERNVKGFYPLELVDLSKIQAAASQGKGKGKRKENGADNEKGFSVVIEEKDGMRYKRIYGFSGYHIRLISKEPYTGSPALPEIPSVARFDASPPPEPAPADLLQRIKGWFR